MYSLVRPPILRNLTTVPAQEAEKYYDWYISNLLVRTNELEAEIQRNADFDNWKASHKPTDLQTIGLWLDKKIDKVHLRYTEAYYSDSQNIGGQTLSDKEDKTQHEYIETLIGVRRNIAEHHTDFSEYIWSLIFDVGMYFGKILVASNAQLEWILYTPIDGKWISSQSPVVMGPNQSVVCEPFGLTYSFAYQLSWNQVSHMLLYETFLDIQNKMVKPLKVDYLD